MIHIIACVVSLFAIGSAAASPPPWPGFSEEVIRAGRASHIKTSSAMNSPARGARRMQEYTNPPEPKGIPLTREAILAETRKPRLFDLSGEVRALGAAALDVLLEILADDSVSAWERDAIARHILPLGAEGQDKRGLEYRRTAIERRQLTEHAGRITDAIIAYHRDNPGAQRLSGFVEIVPLDRLPDILELCEDRQEYLEIFSRLTHTDFYERRYMQTDNPTPEERAEHYRQVIREAREWWTKHRKDGYKGWVTTCVSRDVARIRQRYADQPDRHIRWSRYEHGYGKGIGPSAFETIVKEFQEAPDEIKPYLVGMIATTQHPQAAAFIAPQLESDDVSMLSAAIDGLSRLKASQYAGNVKAVLRSTEDKKLIQDAMRVLSELGKEQALEEIAQWMSHEDINIAHHAQGHLRPYFKTHPDELRCIAARHPDPEVRKKLHFLVDQAITQLDINEIGSAAQSREIVRVIRDLLRSRDPQRRRLGLRLVQQNELVELLPLAVGLLDDEEVGESAAGVLGELGIPELSLETAPLFMGHSHSLDRQIAAWCYEKSGRMALPLIQKVAYELPEPAPDAFRRTGPMPSVGLLKVLIDERAEGVAEQLIETIKSSPHPELFIPVLGFMDDDVTAAFVGDLLTGEGGVSRLRAIGVANGRRLTQYADVLFDIVLGEPNKELWSRAEREYEAGKITYEEYAPIGLDSSSHPTCVCSAAQALMAFGDARAWDAIKHCLLNEYVEKIRSFSAMPFGPMPGSELRSQAAFGVSISRLVPGVRQEMHAMLRLEMKTQRRTHIVLPLTAALAYEPTEEDLHVLRKVAFSSEVSHPSKVLAAMALSRMGERSVAKVLRELLRRKLAGRYYLFWGAAEMRQESKVPRPWEWPKSLNFSVTQPYDGPWLQLHHVDPVGALRQLGDKTMTDEILDALVDERGVFKAESYAILRSLLGTRAYKKAHDRLSRENPEMLSSLQWHELRYDDPQVSRGDAVPVIVKGVDNLLLLRRYVIDQDLTEIVEYVVRLAEQYLEDESSPIYLVLDSLAQLGDPRALSLVAHDPLLLAEMRLYLPDAPPMVPGRFFKYNRVEDALRLQEWYLKHADQLRWDQTSRRFRVTKQD